MLAFKSALLSLICYLLNLNLVSSASGPCFPQNNCQCIFPSGAIIDLSKFPQRTITIAAPNTQVKIAYSPCENVPVVIPPSTNISNPCEKWSFGHLKIDTKVFKVCIFNSTTQIIDGGHKEDLLFASTFQEDPVTATLDKSGWKTIINIDCNKDAGILSSLAVSHYDISTNTVNWFNKLRGQDRPETYENI
ncbi:unnamed protein product [Bemisia tabaci]|uniref:Uncharacterized protein n=1 Tax=Bemisia tabaci TaxID=7038 RepID=A0A9P0A1V3_BEMTA|nr:unnamed protein product [Bemisia tabaci]